MWQNTLTLSWSSWVKLVDVQETFDPMGELNIEEVCETRDSEVSQKFNKN